MRFAQETAQVRPDGTARTTLDYLARHGTLTDKPDGNSWTLIHNSVVAQLRFEPTRTEIRLGLSKNPVVLNDGSVVLETAFPRTQITLPPVARPARLDQVRDTLLHALDLSRPPKSANALKLLEAAVALTLGKAGHTRGVLRLAFPGNPWSVETSDGVRHPLARPADPEQRQFSDLSLPAATLFQIPWCGLSPLPTDGTIIETTAHLRLVAANTVHQIAPLYGLDPEPWI